MIDSVIETYNGKPIPAAIEAKKKQIIKERDELKSKVDSVVAILEIPEVKEMMDNNRERDGNVRILEHLTQNHNVRFCFAVSKIILILAVHSRHGRYPLQVQQVHVRMRKLHRRIRVPLLLPQPCQSSGSKLFERSLRKVGQ